MFYWLQNYDMTLYSSCLNVYDTESAFSNYLASFTSDIGRKRNADHTSSIDISVTGLHPASKTASQPISRVISVVTFELFFGYDIHSNPPALTALIAIGA